MCAGGGWRSGHGARRQRWRFPDAQHMVQVISHQRGSVVLRTRLPLPVGPSCTHPHPPTHPVAADCGQQVAQLGRQVVEHAAVDGRAVPLLQPAALDGMRVQAGPPTGQAGSTCTAQGPWLRACNDRVSSSGPSGDGRPAGGRTRTPPCRRSSALALPWHRLGPPWRCVGLQAPPEACTSNSELSLLVCRACVAFGRSQCNAMLQKDGEHRLMPSRRGIVRGACRRLAGARCLCCRRRRGAMPESQAEDSPAHACSAPTSA